MKKIQKLVFTLSKIGLAMMFLTFTTFAAREFLKCPDSKFLSVSFLVGVMLATFSPIFLTFFSLAGKLKAGEISFNALLRFLLACFLFLAAKHCIGILYSDASYYPSQAYGDLFAETVFKVSTIMIMAYAIRYIRFRKMAVTS
jgi:hypothetical protein